ncbi:MAG: M50 family metallopeptidase [Nanoarchaeota archaeon]|nr:M50 family metallopeptidase [Nanoarchaeota archaeon]
MLSLYEIIDIAIMCLFLGFIFKDVFVRPRQYTDPLKALMHGAYRKGNFWYAVALTAPAVILHEFGHKFVATAYGMQATFQAAYLWLGLGAILKLMNFGFIFFVPAYVTIRGVGSPLAFSIIAFAGPAVNLLIWLAMILVERKNLVTAKHMHYVILTKRINMFLFIFNMLPIPLFDGFQVYSGLLQTIF